MRSMLMAAALASVIGLAGCTYNENPTTQSSADRAQADPMHYSPDMGRNDISGGGIGNLDKQGLKRDIDSVLNP